MQIKKNGTGFVMHKLTGYWKGRVSAWFDQNGVLLDAEHIPNIYGFTSRPVKRGGPMWKAIESKAWMQKFAE